MQVSSKPRAQSTVREPSAESWSTLLAPVPISLPRWPPGLRVVRSCLLHSWRGRGPLSPAERAPSLRFLLLPPSALPGSDYRCVSNSLLTGSLRQPWEVDRTPFITGSSHGLTDKGAELTREGHRMAHGRAAEDPGLKGRASLPPTN